MHLGRAFVFVFVVAFVACVHAQQLGYQPSDPGNLVCPCDDADTCYQEAARLDQEKGEKAETAEQLMVYSQCACFEGFIYACDTIGYFARDWVNACKNGVEIARSCAIAGFVFWHGVQNRGAHGRSFDRDVDAARSAFTKACQAGSKVACDHPSLH
jgi:hypothetical protein